VFVDVSTPVAVRQQIEEKTGLRAVTLDALGTSAADGRNTWAKAMRYNLGQLKRGLE
jgi:ABC-type Zn uptake system ZnuABC Zn-binding protein ZnuA